MKTNRDWTRTFAVTCWLLLSLAGLAPAFAQDSDPGREVRIETITVQGVERDAARNIVTGETRLKEGAVYEESDVVEAIYRVKRLPFVLDAEYELREGSAPGAYELVVTVEAYLPVTLEATTLATYTSDDSSPFTFGEVNGRAFVGGQGLAFGSVQKFEGGDPIADLGYTQYGLFGRGSFVTLTAGHLFTGDEVESNRARLVLGLPVTANNTLRAAYDWSRSDFDFGEPDGFRSTAEGPTLEWIYDTTDDPLLTLRGTQITGAGSYITEKGESDRFGTEEDEVLLLSLQGRHFLPLTARQSLGFRLGTSYSEVQEREFLPSTYTYEAEIGHFANLWSSAAHGWRGDLRLENRVQYFKQDFDFELLPPRDEGSVSLSTGLVFRSPVGILRASVSYFEDL